MFRPKGKQSVEFDEIFMDASNLPAFNRGRLEGRLELPIHNRNVYLIGLLFVVVALVFFGRLFQLQVIHGSEYRERSDTNRINEALIIAERGVIYDRHGELLAWNEHDSEDEYEFPVRAYTNRLGLGQLIGYVSYPQKDRNGFYYRTDYVGRNGLEATFEDTLHGENGTILVEENVQGEVIAASATRSPLPGNPIMAAIDARLSEAMYEIIATSSAQAGIRSGAAVIMDVETGEIVGMTSFPSYDPEVMADGDDLELIKQYEADPRFPFLNKVVGGAYIPGSVVKPFVAYAALAEEVVDPRMTLVSTGEIVIPNPYSPSNPSIFRDWRAHGIVDMRRAIAYSSNVYFYIIGGGFQDQAGLGITAMHRYFTKFGLGKPTGIALENEQRGVVPSPFWKAEVFEDDWRLGDTYFTSIGQYGFLTTPIQLVRAYAALANGGHLLTPQLTYGAVSERIDLGLDPDHVKIIHEGMRMAVNTDGGTARALERNDIAIAAKSGTAELDFSKSHLNSWAAGFWPYEEPKYAFTLLMEHAPYENELGATRVMGDIMEWISTNRPEYLGSDAGNE